MSSSSSTFYRVNTDHTTVPVPLENLFGGTTPSACWLIGGGPSLSHLPIERIAASPVPKMSLNLSGTKLLRPTFWTSYDPSCRFHSSIYLDAGIMKFVHRRRAMDLVPGTGFKVCDSPNLFVFDRDGDRGFADFLVPQHASLPNPAPIIDWADSMVQAIDILYRLGFRVLYLAGCEMHIAPSESQQQLARSKNINYSPGELLGDFVRRCEQAKIPLTELERAGNGPQYHFDEEKPLRAAINTDAHYFRVAQYLRLSRRSLALAGLQLISTTPGSRLNDWFPSRDANDILNDIARNIGDPAAEPTRGLYTQTGENLRPGPPLGPMRDLRPPHWGPEGKRNPRGIVTKGTASPAPSSRREVLSAISTSPIVPPEPADIGEIAFDPELRIEEQGFEPVPPPMARRATACHRCREMAREGHEDARRQAGKCRLQQRLERLREHPASIDEAG